ncbi:MAG: hypothetical protein ACLQBK_16215 [Candidatus Sulfotelmatobacter sp.]
MKRLTSLVPLLLILSPICLVAQNPSASDPAALSLAQQSVAALTRGASVSDVSLTGSVTFVLGSDTANGTGTLKAKGMSESRVDLSLSNSETRADVRNAASGTPAGAWEKNGGAVTAYANHNCWTDAAWFFPALSSLNQTANPAFTFKYMGQEQHGGVNTQHVQVIQPSSVPLLQHLSTIDFYLDPTSALPLAIAFQVHPDLDASKDIAAEVRFASYQPVSGVLIPFQIQRMMSGGVVLNVAVTSAVLNSGLPDSIFSLQ